MKIGIISDTHDNLLTIKQAVEIFNREKVEIVIHAGDHISPFTPTIWQDLKGEILAVFGNNDGDRENLKRQFQKVGKIFQRPREFIIKGKKILVMHEPDNLEDLAASEKYDVIIYGHTHRKKYYRQGKTTVINPGEACGWITGEATAAILNLESGKFEEFILGKSPIPPIAP